MSITYTPTTNFGAKDSLPANDPAKVIKGAEFTTEYSAIQSAFALAAPAANPTITGTATFDDVSITNGLTVDGTTLVVDDTNNRVGIGTASPKTAFDIVNASAARLYLGTDASNYGGLVYSGGVMNMRGFGAGTAAVVSADATNSKVTFTTAGVADRMVIDSSGNVGIGTLNPTEALTVNGTGYFFNAAAEIKLAPDVAIGLDFGASYTSIPAAQNHGYVATATSGAGGANGDLLIASRTSALTNIRFITGSTPTERMRIDSSGNVGIGIDTPTTILDTKGGPVKSRNALTTDASRFELANDSGTAFGQIGLKASSADMFIGSDTVQDSIIIQRSSGNVGIGTTDPQRPLEIGASVPAVRLTDTDVAGLYGEWLTLSDGTWRFRADQGNVQAGSAIAFDIDGSEKMRIDVNGNVGIGTTAPVSYQTGPVLNIGDTADTYAQLNFTGDGTGRQYIGFGDSTTGAARYQGVMFYDHSNNTMNWAANATANGQMTLTSSGRVGVGTDAPDKTLHVAGSSQVQAHISSTNTRSYLQFTDSSSTYTPLIGCAGDAIVVATGASNSERMRIDSTGNVGIGETSPARTLHVGDAMRLEPTSTPASPSAGDLYFDSTTNKLRCYDGTTWQDCF